MTTPQNPQQPWGQQPQADQTQQAQYGQAPYGQAPYGQSPYGQAPQQQAPYGQAPQQQAPYGQAQQQQAPYGQAPYGQQFTQPAAAYPGSVGASAPRTGSGTLALVGIILGALAIVLPTIISLATQGLIYNGDFDTYGTVTLVSSIVAALLGAGAIVCGALAVRSERTVLAGISIGIGVAVLASLILSFIVMLINQAMYASF